MPSTPITANPFSQRWWAPCLRRETCKPLLQMTAKGRWLQMVTVTDKVNRQSQWTWCKKPTGQILDTLNRTKNDAAVKTPAQTWYNKNCLILAYKLLRVSLRHQLLRRRSKNKAIIGSSWGSRKVPTKGRWTIIYQSQMKLLLRMSTLRLSMRQARTKIVMRSWPWALQ